MSSIDPMLLLAGKQPRKKIIRIKQEEEVEPDEIIVGEPEPEEDEEPPTAASTTPPAAEAKPVKPSPYKAPIKKMDIPFAASLVERCRTVIVAHLERYPPAVFGVLEPDEWSTLVHCKHRGTKPERGSGGLDGTGRHAPAISEKYMEAVEQANEHLKTTVTDQLIWKDCCNARFKQMSRPRVLGEPWPLLVERVQAWGRELEQKTTATPRNVIQQLQAAPMNVALLQATQIGKTVKKVTKTIKKENPDDPTGCLDLLTRILNRWKDMAAKDDKQDQDWKLAEQSNSWRELYKSLFEREEKRRADQGQRMRERRENLNVTRPKVVKVRPAKKQHERMINGSRVPVQPPGAGPAAHTTNSKLQKLRQETAVISSRTASSKSQPFSVGKAGFSRAVAVAACAKRKSNAPAASLLAKRMRTAPPQSQAARRPATSSSSSPSLKRPPVQGRSPPPTRKPSGFRR
eukprot:scaffold1171_cov177-Amphora_coffeaeformis.AAC.1